ncbi:ATP-binding protein [Spongisporangium articulatum]|uniref:histidine kinase n=1 Tax=Spongisporangium articulatum TaxID=3362603 RepID=A0ABW8AM20_9ACTN
MSGRGPRFGLRRRATLAFALAALLSSVVLASTTYVVARGYLLQQRERSALRQAYAEAGYVRDRLLTAGVDPSDVLNDIAPRPDARILVAVGGQWYSSDLTDTSKQLPGPLTRVVGSGRPGLSWARLDGAHALAVGVPLPAVKAQFYEISAVTELDRTLRILRTVLAAVGASTSFAAAVLGRYVARRVVRPLDEVATAAGAIAAGRMDTRLPPSTDPDLLAIVASFNAMLDALQDRIEREQRFAADVSHELRSPLTTLVTGVELLAARRDELSPRSRTTLDLVRTELGRFQTTLQDLLVLARLDADGEDSDRRSVTDLANLVREILRREGRPESLLRDETHALPPVVRAERALLERTVVNLLSNADHYAGGPTAVTVRIDADRALVLLTVEDDGPGVPDADKDRIFARFARIETSRGSVQGTGLGLSIVAETVRRHGGVVWCEDAAGAGARFVVQLPREVGS